MKMLEAEIKQNNIYFLYVVYGEFSNNLTSEFLFSIDGGLNNDRLVFFYFMFNFNHKKLQVVSYYLL